MKRLTCVGLSTAAVLFSERPDFDLNRSRKDFDFAFRSFMLVSGKMPCVPDKSTYLASSTGPHTTSTPESDSLWCDASELLVASVRSEAAASFGEDLIVVTFWVINVTYITQRPHVYYSTFTLSHHSPKVIITLQLSHVHFHMINYELQLHLNTITNGSKCFLNLLLCLWLRGFATSDIIIRLLTYWRQWGFFR